MTNDAGSSEETNGLFKHRRHTAAKTFGFALLWGAVAWIDWLFIAGGMDWKVSAGVVVAPHRILLLVVAMNYAVDALLVRGTAWIWRLLVAAVPASYVVVRILR